MSGKTSSFTSMRLVIDACVFMCVLGCWPNAAFSSTTPSTATSCDSLKTLKLPYTTISIAEQVAAGAFHAPPQTGEGPMRDANAFAQMPSFCRLAGDIRPTADSEIRFEVWMPLENWNGRYQGVGNSGLAGTISYGPMAQALTQGYATASTDTGHLAEASQVQGNASWAVGHPEKVIDFGYRSVHETTVKAKAVIAAFYGSDPRYSYWNGCSEGGRQGMGEAQRYPSDFDGILAGSPVFDFVHSKTRGTWSDQSISKNPASYIPAAKYKLISIAVMAQCDAEDGVKDGVINNPPSCHPDLSVLLCKSGDTADCLTAPQIEEMKTEYSDLIDPRTGVVIFPGHSPGFEMMRSAHPATSPADMKQANPGSFFKYFVYENPEWDWTTFNLKTDLAVADKKLAVTLADYDPNLKAFKAHGGKLIQYHGWSDAQPSPLSSVEYFNKVQATMGDTRDFYRLFMVPGMGHCGGGLGTDKFDKIGAITDWVERGKAPDEIFASHMTNGKVDRSRPLCPHPQIAKYKGSGSTDDAANFVCVAP